jgi:hypothetical protein
LESTASKRIMLALTSLAGVIATNAMTAPGRPNMVSSIVQLIVEAFVASGLAHCSYTLFGRRRY